MKLRTLALAIGTMISLNSYSQSCCESGKTAEAAPSCCSSKSTTGCSEPTASVENGEMNYSGSTIVVTQPGKAFTITDAVISNFGNIQKLTAKVVHLNTETGELTAEGVQEVVSTELAGSVDLENVGENQQVNLTYKKGDDHYTTEYVDVE